MKNELNDEMKEELLARIRKHNIQLSSNDALFALLETLLYTSNRYIREVDLLMQQHNATMESTTQRYLSKGKELLEDKLSTAIEDTMIQLTDFKNQSIEELKSEKPQAQISSVWWALLAMSIIMSGAFGYLIALFILT